MLAKLNPYPAYKPSGVEWFGDVPAHWGVRRLKSVCLQSALYGANVTANAYVSDGIRFLRTTDISEDGQLKNGGVFLSESVVRDYVLHDGDLLISRSGTVGRSFLYNSEIHGPCAYAGYLVRFVPAPIVAPKFLFLYTKTQVFTRFLQVMAISSTIENVNGEKYANAALPLPPLPEQATIVRYLDHADRRIRRYVGAKRKLIALLEEERQAVVSRAVTRGLDPNVRLKPSGVEWLGDVPTHWEVVQLGRIGVFSKGSGGTKDDEVPDGTPCVRYGDLYTTHKSFISQTRSYVSPAKASAYTPIKRGEVLFPTSGETIEEIGKSAVNLMHTQVLCGGDLIIFRPTIPIEPKFAGYALDCPAAQTQKSLMGRGITIMHIYSGQLKYLWLSLPPLPEQAAIVEHLDRATADIDAAIARARRQIELVQEYRTRLIADVVTGKLDVREAAAQLPDEGDDREPVE